MAFDPDTLSPNDFAAAAAAAIAASAHGDLSHAARRLADDGLLGILAIEEIGGLGLPESFAMPVLSAAGAARSTFPLLETIFAARLLQGRLPDAATALVAGEALVSVAWSGEGSVGSDDDGVRLDGVVGRASHADKAAFILLATDDGGAAVVSTGSAGVDIRPASGIDPDRPAFELHLADVRVSTENIVSAEEWQAFRLACLQGWAALILGASEACLAMAEEHANTRRQFGKALSANQALRHILARQKLVLENMRAALASCFEAPSSSLQMRSRAAFLAAVEGGVFIIEKSIQIHGGMGFTWDMPLHRYLRWVRDIQAQADADHVLLDLADDFIAQVA
ncbi:acyl-CoA dehydrogenase family protein [Oryzicola mucosus]|uniref:Acyl-CoA/acyl-ACP dehydrogenase n=1 Tax=Oryzicola mucosus TaxID=2767425 RepID=A0A8J6PU03_9HYPH|nr:acyl-CoA dehydrogenase family protein [Oryzicola mucosus]MBD0415544.1 acyl-CoA/acyl-ACP dehydrogenase [Oryzicola mucosus]